MNPDWDPATTSTKKKKKKKTKKRKPRETAAKRAARIKIASEAVLNRVDRLLHALTALRRDEAERVMERLEDATWVATEGDDLKYEDGSTLDCTDYALNESEVLQGIRLYLHSQHDIEYAGDVSSSDFYINVGDRLRDQGRIVEQGKS